MDRDEEFIPLVEGRDINHDADQILAFDKMSEKRRNSLLSKFSGFSKVESQGGGFRRDSMEFQILGGLA